MMENEAKTKEASILFSFNVGRYLFKLHALPQPGWAPEVIQGYNHEAWKLVDAVATESPEAALKLCDAMM